MGQGQASGSLGLVSTAMGDYEQAITYHQKDLAVAREIGDISGEGRALGNLGIVYQQLKEIDQALAGWFIGG